MRPENELKPYKKPSLSTFGGIGELTQNISTANGGDNLLKLGGKKSI